LPSSSSSASSSSYKSLKTTLMQRMSAAMGFGLFGQVGPMVFCSSKTTEPNQL
jgi:hypothetical protein